jgi:lysophospholipase L1-like esterase
MKKIIVYIFLLAIVLFAGRKLLKPPPFKDEVEIYKKQDKLNPPSHNAILFVGSSSITKWTDIQKAFPSYPIILRGLGGASYPDIIRFADDIIYPYQPKQIFIYCGDNDFAYYENITPQKVAIRFETLFYLIRKELPAANINFISIKPSPARHNLESSFQEANRLVKAFLEKQSNTGYVNIHDAMLGSDGRPNASLYIADSLHMNKNGYQIWGNIIRPYLK